MTTKKTKPKPTRKPKPLRGAKLLRAALTQIERHPATWGQALWKCGTKFCFGGWCARLANPTTKMETNADTGIAAFDALENLCELSEEQVQYITEPHRTLPEIREFVKMREQKEKGRGK